MSVEVEVKDGAQLAQAVAGPLCEKLKVPRHLADLWRRLGAEVGLRGDSRGGWTQRLQKNSDNDR
jgi:hypothetical protein